MEGSNVCGDGDNEGEIKGGSVVGGSDTEGETDAVFRSQRKQDGS